MEIIKTILTIMIGGFIFIVALMIFISTLIDMIKFGKKIWKH